MKLFKRMNKIELLHSKRAALLGFFTYMLITAINYFSYLLINKDLFSPPIIFWSGIAVFFGYDTFLNLKEKRGDQDSDG
ncbi:hypothetical protein SporoP37_03705 [Sporosarcina sp. P37]|nr:hypothetical protein SporoP37_03705 [Sporosarcina sp. P37]PID17786.1 hypothetical protein CSV62_11495 [Sporosarcina sp. P35]